LATHLSLCANNSTQQPAPQCAYTATQQRCPDSQSFTPLLIRNSVKVFAALSVSVSLHVERSFVDSQICQLPSTVLLKETHARQAVHQGPAWL